MGNRSIIYTQEQPRTFDVLWGWRDALIAASYLQQDLAGNTSTVVSGFTPLASSPASLVFALGAGRIYEQAEVDATQYGSLPSDTDLIMQQGFAAGQSITLSTAALSAGQSQWALVEVAFGQVDVIRANDPTGGVLYYWNSADPTVPFQGPNGDGQTQPTEREGVASVQVVYGAPAATGSEVPPTPSAGSVPLYLVDLAFGQTAVTQGEIITAGPSVGANVPSNYPAMPLLAGLLNSHHNGAPGQAPKIKMAELAAASSANTGAGVSSVYSYAGNPNGHVAGVAATTGLTAPDLCFDTTNNILYFCTVTGNAAGAVWSTASGQAVNFVGGTSTGTANAQVVTPVSPSGFALVNGYSVTFTPGITNTTATTLAVAGTAATACRKNSGGTLVAFAGNEFIATEPVTMVYNGTFWVLQTGALGSIAFLNIGQWLKNDGSGNLTIKNGALLGDDGSGNLNILNTGVTAGSYTRTKLTVNAAGQLTAAASGAYPTRTVLTSGTGTYTVPANAKRLFIRMVGAGGGGGGTGTGGGAGGNGTATVFNAIVANPGAGALAVTADGGAAPSLGGAGGSSGTGSASLRFAGADGSAGQNSINNVVCQNGGDGGSSLFGGRGASLVNVNSQAAKANTGSGGGGAGWSGGHDASGAGGGGAGEYLELQINNPGATYTYTVGAGGAGGVIGTNSGLAGGAGADGIIIIDEYYD